MAFVARCDLVVVEKPFESHSYSSVNENQTVEREANHTPSRARNQRERDPR